MFRHIRPVWAEINLDALAYNINKIKTLSGDKEIIAVVKADAYGHGAIDISKALIESGIKSLAVAVISEAIELRKAGIDCEILILGYTPDTFLESIIKYNLTPTVFSYLYAKKISDIAVSFNTKVKIHIAVDSGMGRIGFIVEEESIREIQNISKLKNLDINGIFTHFSSADEKNKEYTYNQMNKFLSFLNDLKKIGIEFEKKHISNSAAVIDIDDKYSSSIRPGIIMYGYYPSHEVNKDRIHLKPVMKLKTNIIHIKELPKDSYISYGRSYKTTREKEIIATLPVGYADGYNRGLSGKANVIVNGKYAKVVGRVCMDQCMINISDISDVNIGDEVTLIGDEGDIKITADDIAKILDTINYEVLCSVSKRVPRVYIKDGKVIKVRNYL